MGFRGFEDELDRSISMGSNSIHITVSILIDHN